MAMLLCIAPLIAPEWPTTLDLRRLDRKSAVPLYHQIQLRLLEQIRRGALKSGQSLPPEEELAERFGVSRMTGRQALKALRDLGVTYTVKGKGTFVSGMKLAIDCRQVLSFTEEMQRRGWRPMTKVLSFELTTADTEAANALGLRSRKKVFSLRRLRIANSSPMGIEWSRIPHHLCPDLLKSYDPRTSLYHTLAAQYGIRIAIADEVVEAGLAEAQDARLLRIARKSPVFQFTRTCHMQSGEPVEFVKSVYRSDRYRIVNRLSRQNGLAAGAGKGD